MNLKKILIISSIILILSLTTVSASDMDNLNTTQSSNDSLVLEHVEVNNDIKNNGLDALPNATAPEPDLNKTDLNNMTDIINPGSINDLKKEIDNTPVGSTLYLTRDYILNGNININKDITIDGQGHTFGQKTSEKLYLFSSEAGKIIFKNLIFRDIPCDDIFNIFTNAQYSIENCRFINNKRVIYTYGPSLRLKNCIFESNSDGGIVAFGDVNIYNSTFDKSAVTCYGNIFAYDSIFKNNQGIYGGGLCGYENVNVYNCIFDNNKAKKESGVENNGGGIYSKGDVTIENSTFINNNAYEYGGAVFAKGNVYINVNQRDKQSFFINNQATDENGGAICAEGNIVMYNTILSKNQALVDGGAAYGKKNVFVTNCVFDSNKADGAKSHQCWGGAIRAEDNVKIDNSTFKNNYAENKGGAVYASTVTFTGSKSYFDHNTARDYGGAIYVNKFTNNVNNVSFTSNKAEKDDGGAIYIYNENWITFSQCVFTNNKCDDEGGAIYLDSKSSHLTLKENIFKSNSANEGQAVYNCGHYDSITNNFWGGKNPSSSNDELIEWRWPLANIHHTDSNPLGAILIYDDTYKNHEVIATLFFIKSDGSSFDGNLDLSGVSFDINPNITIIDKKINTESVELILLPKIGNIYTIKANIYGYTLSKTLDVSKINIIAPKITTYYDVPEKFKIHLDGEKNLIKNQKITVTLNSKDYDVLTDANGDASIYFNNYSMNPGTYEILIKAGDLCSKSAITILPDINITAPNISSYYGGSREFKIHLEGNKKFCVHQKVRISFINLNYEIYSDENGDVNLCLDNPMAAGTYNILISVLNINAQATFKIKTTIEGEDIVRVYGDYTPFTATFRNSNGEYLPNYALVQYSIDNSMFSFINVRGNEGQALFNIAFLNPGYHFITLYNPETKELKYYDINILPQYTSVLEKLDIEKSASQLFNQNTNNNNKIALSTSFHDMNNENHQIFNASNDFNHNMNAPVKNIESGNMFSLSLTLVLGIFLIMGAGCSIYIMKR